MVPAPPAESREAGPRPARSPLRASLGWRRNRPPSAAAPLLRRDALPSPRGAAARRNLHGTAVLYTPEPVAVAGAVRPGRHRAPQHGELRAESDKSDKMCQQSDRRGQGGTRAGWAAGGAPRRHGLVPVIIRIALRPHALRRDRQREPKQGGGGEKQQRRTWPKA